MNHFVFSAFLAFITTGLTGTFFLFKRTKKSRLFGTYWLSIAFWSSTVAFQSFLLKIMPDYVWGWLLHLGCLFIPVLFYHFAVLYSGRRDDNSYLVAGYLLTAIFLIFNTFTDLFTKGISYRDKYAYPTPSLFYISYFLCFITMLIRGTWLMLKPYRHIPIQLRNWLYAFILFHSIAYMGGMDNFLIMADIRLHPLYPYGLYAVVPYALIGAYVIPKVEGLKPIIVQIHKRKFSR